MPGGQSTISGSESDRMCFELAVPALGLIGVIGTPASSAPMTATAISGSFTAQAATRCRPSTCSATAVAASRSSR